jgi:probable HAF family extracellular repeat protein
VADVLLGDVNPGGKLLVSWPRTAGSEPLYYNHTRTHDPEDEPRFTSRTWDVNSQPLYPFGYGLSSPLQFSPYIESTLTAGFAILLDCFIDNAFKLLGGNELRAVIWKNGEIHDLGTFGGSLSLATGVNNRGQVVGLALTSTPDPFPVPGLAEISTGTQTQAFVWQNGHMRNLGTRGGPDAAAYIVNDRGQVAGGSYTNGIPNASTGYPTLHPFLWENGRMIDLGTLGGTSGGPIALNNRGQVLGNSNLAGDQSFDVFLWQNGQLIDLTAQSSGGRLLLASAINDAGQVVGGTSFPGRDFDAAVWRNGVLTDLGTLDGDCYSFADSINSRSQIVGSSYPCDGSIARAFLWQDGRISDLNDLIPADSGLQLAGCPPDGICPSIFDNGDIAGSGIMPGSGCNNAVACGTSFLLHPTGFQKGRERQTLATGLHHLPAAVSKKS